MSFRVIGFVGNQVASVDPIRFISISSRSVSPIAVTRSISTRSVSTGSVSSRSRSTQSIIAQSAKRSSVSRTSGLTSPLDWTILLRMSLVSAIIADDLVGFAFPFVALLILQLPAVFCVVRCRFAVGTPFVSFPTTLSSFSFFRLLAVECFRYRVWFDHHCLVAFAFLQGVDDLLDCDADTRLENFDGNREY